MPCVAPGSKSRRRCGSLHTMIFGHRCRRTSQHKLQREAKEQGVDRCDEAGDVRLTETEVRDIRALNSAFEDFVLVLNVGGVVDLAPVAEVATVLLMSQLGSAAGDAVADVLLGTSYPSGKLTTTWAAVTDDPSTEGFGGRACTGVQRCHNAGQCARFAGDSCRHRQSDAYVSADACRFAKIGDAPSRTGVGPCAYEAIRDLNVLPCICAAVFFVHSAGKRCKIKENLF